MTQVTLLDTRVQGPVGYGVASRKSEVGGGRREEGTRQEEGQRQITPERIRPRRSRGHAIAPNYRNVKENMPTHPHSGVSHRCNGRVSSYDCRQHCLFLAGQP